LRPPRRRLDSARRARGEERPERRGVARRIRGGVEWRRRAAAGGVDEGESAEGPPPGASSGEPPPQQGQPSPCATPTPSLVRCRVGGHPCPAPMATTGACPRLGRLRKAAGPCLRRCAATPRGARARAHQRLCATTPVRRRAESCPRLGRQRKTAKPACAGASPRRGASWPHCRRWRGAAAAWGEKRVRERGEREEREHGYHRRDWGFLLGACVGEVKEWAYLNCEIGVVTLSSFWYG